MKKKIFSKLVGLVICALCLMVFPMAGMAAEISFKLGHVAPPNTIYDVSANKFAERVATNTGGRVEVKVFGHSQFGTLPEHWAQVKKGAIDIFVSEPLVAFIIEPPPKNFFVLVAPYLFETQEHLHKFLSSDLFKSMMDKVEKAGNVKYLGFLGDRPPRQLTTTNTKVMTPNDLKGLKLRSPALPPFVEVWKEWGATPTPLPAKDIYTGLKSGLVVGQENTILATRDAGYYEVQKYIVCIDYIRSNLCAWMNQQRWDSLPNDLKGAIEKSATETKNYVNEYAADQERKAEKFLKEKGMIVLRPDLEPFKALAVKANLRNDGKLWEKGLYDKIKSLK